MKMGTGNFKQPPPGPKIGPTVRAEDLAPDKRAELGDFDNIFKPAALDPRVLQEQQASTVTNAVVDDQAARFDALQHVLAEEQPAEPIATNVVVTDEDRKEFLRALLGDRKYTKRYELFGGAVRVVCRDLTMTEEDALFAELARLQREGELTTEADWELMLDRLRLLVATDALTIMDKQLATSVDWTKPLAPQSAVQLGRITNGTVYRALLQVVRQFGELLDSLLDRSMDSDFWRADGRDSPSEPAAEEQSTTQNNLP
jgi:hypothetical protein